MSHISHAPIAWGIDQPTNFTVVADSPGSFDEFEAERFGIDQVGIGCESPEVLWIPEDVGVSIMEDDVGVEELREGLVEQF